MKMKKFSFAKTMDFVGRFFYKMGQQLVYSVLIMCYAYKNKGTPVFAKRIILGAIGYLVTPIDALPDLTPLVGFTDDLGVLGFALVAIASHITDDIRIRARKDVKRFFGEVDLEALQQVDAKL